MDENQVIEKRATRRSRGEVERLVEEFLSSGTKRSEFCRRKNLRLGTLNRHLSRRTEKAQPGPRLVAVELESSPGQKANAIEVVLARGRRVEVRPGFDASTLQAVIAVLERV
jgi:hypothetical protein